MCVALISCAHRYVIYSSSNVLSSLQFQDNKSYVCDVNGWSFVKRSEHYYDDASRTIRHLVLNAIAPDLLHRSGPMHHMSSLVGIGRSNTTSHTAGSMMPMQQALNSRQKGASPELLCVIAVIRHSDRNPKEKLKLTVEHPELLELFQRWGPAGMATRTEIKLKSRQQLVDVLQRVRHLLVWH